MRQNHLCEMLHLFLCFARYSLGVSTSTVVHKSRGLNRTCGGMVEIQTRTPPALMEMASSVQWFSYHSKSFDT